MHWQADLPGQKQYSFRHVPILLLLLASHWQQKNRHMSKRILLLPGRLAGSVHLHTACPYSSFVAMRVGGFDVLSCG